MTTIWNLPTAWAVLDAHLRARRPVWVSYHRLERLVCPHALGWKAARLMVLTYQIGGQTTSGPLDPDPHRRWRAMYVDEIERVAPADLTSIWQTADNYNCSDPFPAVDELVIAVTGPPWDESSSSASIVQNCREGARDLRNATWGM